MSTPEIQTPELDKMKLHGDQTQAASDFLDWLHDQDFEIAMRPEGRELLRPVMEGKDSLLARWKNIDLREAERERQAVLDNFLNSQEN